MTYQDCIPRPLTSSRIPDKIECWELVFSRPYTSFLIGARGKETLKRYGGRVVANFHPVKKKEKNKEVSYIGSLSFGARAIFKRKIWPVIL